MNANIPTVENQIDIIKISIDMHLQSYRGVRQLDFSSTSARLQLDFSAPPPAQRFEPAKFYPWLQKQIAHARRVGVCYEAGCFGYEPARRMQKLGAEVRVIAPQDWDEQGKGQVNDQLDASVMCRRLSDYLCGHRKALSIVHIPTPEEEARRAQGRLREQLRRHLARMRAMGRSLLLQRELVVKGRWWTAANWQRIEAQMPAWVIAPLELWKKIIAVTEGELAALEATLAASRAEATLCR